MRIFKLFILSMYYISSVSRLERDVCLSLTDNRLYILSCKSVIITIYVLPS